MEAAPYAQELAHLLDDDAVGLRWTLADGLTKLGHSGAEALSSRLKDSNPIIRETASTSLQQMGWPIAMEASSSLAGIHPMTQTPRKFQYNDQADVSNIPSHVLMRARGPVGTLSQSASPRVGQYASPRIQRRDYSSLGQGTSPRLYSRP